jgi:hypothetical protein
MYIKNHQLFTTDGLIILLLLVMPGTGNPTTNLRIIPAPAWNYHGSRE